jgi:hypothetical protein
MPLPAGWRGKKVLSSGVAPGKLTICPWGSRESTLKHRSAGHRLKHEHFGGLIVFLLREPPD